ncbi:cellulase family glycosylhydrolase [Rapidithrix thailandica]|uniref:Cellulase family glycosylhydrolase n=1 Tax=Rapidithrix thailandica TaxID=413964 RepID=A0AAW9SF48_9BACT
MKYVLTNILWLGILGAVLQACLTPQSEKEEKTAETEKFVTSQGQKFLDPEGQQLILHGVNVVNKEASTNYLGHVSKADFQQFKQWGFNCIRLGVIWDGLEPEPGLINEAYLKGIDEQIAWAKEAGLYVFLDMHQDLFSQKFADGAPAWATLDEGKPHIADGPVWSDAYFTSPAVQTAFDNFWINAKASDGVGVQDHYANVWKKIAQRYANEPTVIGYDLMNEPVSGSLYLQSMPFIAARLAEVLHETDGEGSWSVEQIGQMWSSPEQRVQVLQKLNDIEVYAATIDTLNHVFQAFEKEKLMPFYQKVANAIREVDNKHILFMETNINSNMGVLTGIEPLMTGKGMRDPQQGYAPHAYDIVVDTDLGGTPTFERVELIMQHHYQSSQRLNMPMLVGEWGAFYGTSNALPAVSHMMKEFEKYLCGNTYWEYSDLLNEPTYLSAIIRPYPMQTVGNLLAYRTDSNSFSCIWEEPEGQTGATVIYLPFAGQIENTEVVFTTGKGISEVKMIEPGRPEGYLVIPSLSQGGKRELNIRLRNVL